MHRRPHSPKRPGRRLYRVHGDEETGQDKKIEPRASTGPARGSWGQAASLELDGAIRCGWPQRTQLTNFADSATSPALSPNGGTLAFIRGEYTFGAPGQIYVKILRDGEPVQLTHDDLNKRGSPKFSPDGTRIAYAAYTRVGLGHLGRARTGRPAAPVSSQRFRAYLDRIRSQAVPALVFRTDRPGATRWLSLLRQRAAAEHRTVYMPAETGMAHRSYLSPDRKQVLLAEMDHGSWLPCRLTPFDGSSPGRPVGSTRRSVRTLPGPQMGSGCTSRANTGNGYHIWRQRFPDGVPEQITSGVTQEEGIEVAPDGRSFVHFDRRSQSTVWFHDSRGDRQITSEGYGLLPSVSPDGWKLYYLLRAGGARHFVSGELWVADLESGQRQRLLLDFLIQHYAVSAEGQCVVFVVSDDAGHSPVWLAGHGYRQPEGILRRGRLRALRGRGERGKVHLSHQKRRQ
jgi:eukaryotic-like serine/threonine-protein kinase